MTANLFARLYEQDLKIIFSLDAASRAVYLALTFFGSSSIQREGSEIKRHCYPSQEKMAALLGCSTGTIRRGIARLKRTAVDGTLLFTKDADGKITDIPDHDLYPKMLIVRRKMFKNEYYLNIDSSSCELNDSSSDELRDISNNELSNISHIELSDSSHDELSIIDTENITSIKQRIEPEILSRFQLIFDYFSEHRLTQWRASNALNEFILLADRSSLNIHMELLHIGAFQLEKIRLFEEGHEDKRFWRNAFWVSGMSQWLGRKHKSTLDWKRSAYIADLKRLIPDLEPSLKAFEEVQEEPVVTESSSGEQDENIEFAREVIQLAAGGEPVYLSTLWDFHKSTDFPQSLKQEAIDLLKSFDHYRE